VKGAKKSKEIEKRDNWNEFKEKARGILIARIAK
jgi:hypothetical protein